MATLAAIFDEKIIIQNIERKKIGQIRGRISIRRLVRNLTIQISLSSCRPNITTLACSFTEIFYEKFHQSKVWKERQSDKYEEELAGESWFAIPRYIIINLHTVYDNSSLHSFTEIFDENIHYLKYGNKEIGQIQGRISMWFAIPQ